MIQAKRSFVKCGDWFTRISHFELCNHVSATMCLHPSVSLNNEKICREFSEHKIAVCEKTAGLRRNSSDLDSYNSQTCTTKLNDIGTQQTV